MLNLDKFNQALKEKQNRQDSELQRAIEEIEKTIPKTREQYLEGNISPRARRLIQPNRRSTLDSQHPYYKWAMLFLGVVVVSEITYIGYQAKKDIDYMGILRAEQLEQVGEISISEQKYQHLKNKK